jgi:hypothetical protein
MPTIASPPNLRNYDRWSNDVSAPGETKPPRRSLAVWLSVATKRHAITEELSAGADPNSSAARALRASQLVSRRSRRQMARALRRSLDEAHRPALGRGYVVIIRRGAVLQAEDAISAMIRRLAAPEPVTVRGMALIYQMLTDGASSPLYKAAEAGALTRRVLAVTEALDGESTELPVAA